MTLNNGQNDVHKFFYDKEEPYLYFEFFEKTKEAFQNIQDSFQHQFASVNVLDEIKFAIKKYLNESPDVISYKLRFGRETLYKFGILELHLKSCDTKHFSIYLAVNVEHSILMQYDEAQHNCQDY